MIRVIHNSLKHLYYGSLLNLLVVKIEGYFISKKIEKNILDRGDTILSNRSYIGKTLYYTKRKPNKRYEVLDDIHEGAYKFYPAYTTQQQLDEMRGYSSNTDELQNLLKILYEAEAKVRIKNENNSL